METKARHNNNLLFLSLSFSHVLSPSHSFARTNYAISSSVCARSCVCTMLVCVDTILRVCELRVTGLLLLALSFRTGSVTANPISEYSSCLV